MSDDIWDALTQEDDFSPVFKFKEPGDNIKGGIAEKPVTVPLTEYKSDEPKLDRDGNPVKQVMLVLATDRREDEDHDGRWRVYLDKRLLKAAVLRALKDAGARVLEVGGEISLTFTGYRQVGGGQAKEFDVKYTPPRSDGSFGFAEPDDDSAPW